MDPEKLMSLLLEHACWKSSKLDDAGSLGACSQESTSLQFFARAKLSQHWACPLHSRGEPGRNSTCWARWPGFDKLECGLHSASWQGKEQRDTASVSAEIQKPPT